MASEAQAQAPRTKWLQRFTAVDLITIAIFAVLTRFVFYYIYRALYIAFPWNKALMPMFNAISITAMWALVPKAGATTLYTIAWQLLNLFFQGEDISYVLLFIPIVIAVEAVFFWMKRYGDDFRSALFGAMIYVSLGSIAGWIVTVYVFLIEWPLVDFRFIWLLATLISAPIGAYIGNRLGHELKRLVV